MANLNIGSTFTLDRDVVVFQGDCLDLLPTIPDGAIQLVVTSPPYNLGKTYERHLQLDEYVSQQSKVISECVRVLSDTGSLCWQVGNYVENGAIIPLDILLYPVFSTLGLSLRNRIVWSFGHGLHASKRFSGRYEVILWFTKSDQYVFNLDAVRVPQKYPGKKYFKGPKKGQLSGNPLGKNPSDVWDIPNVKANHVEKTIHPCQYPVELIERLVLALTHLGDWVLDPFAGVGTTAIASLMHQRKAVVAEMMPEYVEITRDRLNQAEKGTLRVRPMGRSVYDPHSPSQSIPPMSVRLHTGKAQLRLLESESNYEEGKPER